MLLPQDRPAWTPREAFPAGDAVPLAALLDTLGDLWFVLDADGRHLEASRARHALLPMPHAQLRGLPLGHGLAPALADRWRSALQQLRCGGGVQCLRDEIDGSDGQRHVVEVRVAALEHGAALFLLRDCTAEDALQRARCERQAAEIANRTKSEFLSRVSHEMRTPLNAVIGFTQLLRLAPEGAGPAQVAEFTDHVLRASQRLLALVNDLLDLQRVEENRLTLEPRPLALRDLVDAVFALQRPLAAQHGVALRNAIDPAARVLADAQRTRQVLLNLVANAIQYNRTGGWVHVALQAPADGRLVFTVEDNGTGLDPDQVARLFQPFERLGRESSEAEGSGLGLVIARRLTEAMDGSLELGPRAGGIGTVARVALPQAADAVVPPAVADPVPQALRVLYVEDNRINAILFEEAMRLQRGIALALAEDGAAALQLAPTWLPQVLVLDANLPDMNGYELLARLRALPALAGVPAYMCSADAQDEDLRRAREAGFVGYWTKPIDIARVLSDLRPLRPGSAPGDSKA